MKKQNGFIATSLLYSFFLAFITLFVAMLSIYLQNRVYLNKLEDSSKNSIYIREMKEKIYNNGANDGTVKVYINDDANYKTFTKYEENIFTFSTNTTCNAAKCELIYYNGGFYYLEGCTSC